MLLILSVAGGLLVCAVSTAYGCPVAQACGDEPAPKLSKTTFTDELPAPLAEGAIPPEPEVSDAPVGAGDPRELAAVAATPRTSGAAADSGWEAAIVEWPEDARLAARAAAERYGPPDEHSPSRLSWTGAGPFVRVVALRDGPVRERPWPLREVLLQTAALPAPGDAAAALERIGAGLSVDGAGQLVTAASDSEALNFLALNLASDVLAGRRDAESASEEYSKAAALSVAGKTVPEMQGLLFDSARRPHDR